MIRYNHGNISNHVDDLQSKVNAMNDAREEVDKLFNSMSTIHEGQAHEALMQAKQQILAKLEEMGQNLHQLHRGVEDQNQHMHQQDVSQAHDFA